MLVGGGLGYQDTMRLVSRLDEVMGPNVGHDFGARQDFDIKLIFDFLKLLDVVLALWSAAQEVQHTRALWVTSMIAVRWCLCCDAPTAGRP